MIKQPSLFSAKFLLLLAALVLAGYFIYKQFSDRLTISDQPDTPTPIFSKVEAKPVSHTAALADKLPPALASGVAANVAYPATFTTTYLLGVTRARKLVSGGMKNMMYDDKKNWWLYAQSEKDADWLDKFGYPTPEEYNRLINASDAELEVLTKNGDINAKIHLAARFTKKAFETGVKNDSYGAIQALHETLNGGGPYQAAIIVRTFQEMQVKFRRLPAEEQTEERRNLIQNLSDVEMTAAVMSRLYGDEPGMGGGSMTNANRSKYIGLREQPEMPVDAVTSTITAQAGKREYLGLPPLVIIPRPFAHYKDGKDSIERY